jgi:hypothetical protein
MNPWSKEKSLNLFKQYLDNLEENDLLCAMLSNQEAVSLL